MKIVIACGNGIGSSLACKMAVESVLKDLGTSVQVDHCSMLSASSTRADILMGGINFKTQFDQFSGYKYKIYLNSLVNRNEIRDKLVPVLSENGII